MARYASDQSKVVLFFESGTYANISGTGQWPGLVQSHSITENENVIQTRYLGQGNRNVGRFDQGPLDVEGTLTIFPQDWRLLGYALGSIFTTSGTAQTDNYRFDLSEVNSDVRHNPFTSGTLNPWISFALEESRTGNVASKNFMRTIRGAVVNNYALNITQGEPVTVEVGFIAQTGSWFSGTTTAVTAGSNRPYLWSDVRFQIPSGTTFETVKNFNFTLNNNFEAPHYINGSRQIAVPFPLNRDYSVEITQDLTDAEAGSLWDVFFKGGSQFNAHLSINNTANTGSHHLVINFSGCRMTEMEVPAGIEGISEVNYTFVPGSINAVAFDRMPLYTIF